MLNIIGVIVAFIVVILLIRKKWNFGATLLLGSLIVGIFSLQEIQPVDIAKAFLRANIYSMDEGKISTTTLELALIMLFINILAVMMQETGAMTKLIDSLRRVFSKGSILAVIPAVFGLLPVPGGALFSAPMVDKEGDKLGVSKENKTILNVWFRHIWFFVYPFSSAMILICSQDFSNINIYDLVAIQIPGFLFMAIIGVLILKRSIPEKVMKENNIKENFEKRGLLYLIPIILPIMLSMLISIFSRLPSTTSILISLPFGILALLGLLVIDGLADRNYSKILKKGLSWKLPLAIVGIMTFREMIKTSGTVEIISSITSASYLPAIIIIVLVPFIFGVITGYNLGAVALSYPIIEPLSPLVGTNIVAITSLIFTSSLVGYIISPVHLCVVVSCEYFKTDLSKVYKRFVPAALSLVIIDTIFMIPMLG
ncbi:MAG: hypothetical protein DRN09_03450 [Thermoplasmata archaeon]|nr:MAG: hypothetical protein DRN09_03450 [Thermoplasmata archaeon]